jgi:hypothetical protein
MTAEFWDNIHQTKQHDVSWWQDSASLWVDLFDHCTTKMTDGIIDVGAGASLFIDEAAKRGYWPLFVNDLSITALNEIKERFKNSEIAVQIRPSDICDLTLELPVGLWHDRAVFHFLTSSEQQNAYKKSVLRNTTSDANIILATFAPSGPEACSGLNVKQWSAEQLAEFFAPDFTLVFSDERVHVTPWQSEQKFSVVVLKRVPRG